MENEKDILLTTAGVVDIYHGDFVIGESLGQEVAHILQLNKGDLKSDPLLGPDLLQLILSGGNEAEFIDRVKVHLRRDGKEYRKVKKYVQQNFITQ